MILLNNILREVEIFSSHTHKQHILRDMEKNIPSYFIACINNISKKLINDQTFRAQVRDCKEAAS